MEIDYIVAEGSEEGLGALDLHFVVPVLQRYYNETNELFIGSDFA
jgi:hypothetical protein